MKKKLKTDSGQLRLMKAEFKDIFKKIKDLQSKILDNIEVMNGSVNEKYQKIKFSNPRTH